MPLIFFLPYFDTRCDILLSTRTADKYFTRLSYNNHNFRLITGLPMGKPSRGLRLVFLFSFFSFFSFFSVSVKVLPVTPLVSGVFVYRAFCAYFLRIERVVELRRFLQWTQ